jgi:hypothetical protein
MSSTLPQSAVATQERRSSPAFSISDSSSSVPASDSSFASESRARLVALLSADVVELRSVCDEIRSLPQLETLIVRLTAPSIPVASSVPATLEQAIVLLGTDHLRALVRAWSGFPPGHNSESNAASLLDPAATAAGRGPGSSTNLRLPRR